jgi:hypothetical protein
MMGPAGLPFCQRAATAVAVGSPLATWRRELRPLPETRPLNDCYQKLWETNLGIGHHAYLSAAARCA